MISIFYQDAGHIGETTKSEITIRLKKSTPRIFVENTSKKEDIYRKEEQKTSFYNKAFIDSNFLVNQTQNATQLIISCDFFDTEYILEIM
jgi:hypothetical protein